MLTMPIKPSQAFVPQRYFCSKFYTLTSCAASTMCPRLLQVVTWTATQNGLVTLTFDLWPWNWCEMSVVAQKNFPANFGVSETFRCRVMGKHASDWRHGHLITLIFDVTAHVADAGHRTPSLYQVWSSSVSPSEDVAHFPSQQFDLSTSKWGHRLPVSWASFPPIFSLPSHSILHLGSGTGQTDGQRDNGYQRLMPHPIGAGIIKNVTRLSHTRNIGNKLSILFKVSAILRC